MSEGAAGVNIRLLGGEIFAALFRSRNDDLSWEEHGRVVDVVMGVLARHAGEELVNDPALPVAPLPTPDE